MTVDDLLENLRTLPAPVLRKVYVWRLAPMEHALRRDGILVIHTSWWEELAAEARPPFDGDLLSGVPVLYADGSPRVRSEMFRDLGWLDAWEALLVDPLFTYNNDPPGRRFFFFSESLR